jgi:hypothetical protein
MQRIVISRMEIKYFWENGHTATIVSPKNKKLESRMRKRIGGFFVSLGCKILFGRGGWTTDIGRVKEGACEDD